MLTVIAGSVNGDFVAVLPLGVSLEEWKTLLGGEHTGVPEEEKPEVEVEVEVEVDIDVIVPVEMEVEVEIEVEVTLDALQMAFDFHHDVRYDTPRVCAAPTLYLCHGVLCVSVCVHAIYIFLCQ